MNSPKVCHVVFSTSRFPYLARTFASLKNLDWTGCERHGILIDDYPKDRDNWRIERMAKDAGFSEVILHPENKGLSVTWAELYRLIRGRGYDYVLHQEDDVELITRVRVKDLIDIFESNDCHSQIKLKRNRWYSHEGEDYYDLPSGAVKHGDLAVFPSTTGVDDHFSTLFSLYNAWVCQEITPDSLTVNPNEGAVAQYLVHHHNCHSAVVSRADGSNLVRHIGEYTRGIRVLEGEPGWEQFVHMDPARKYSSKTGQPWLDDK